MAERLSEHKLSKFRVGVKIFYALLCFAIFIFALIYLLTAATAGPLGLLIAVVGVSCFVLGLALTVQTGLKLWRNPRLAVYEQGLAYRTRRGKKLWAWKHFSELKSSVRRPRLLGIIPLPATHRHTLYTSKDRRKALSVDEDYQDIDELTDMLELMTAQTLWPRYVDAFQASKTLAFGKMRINDTGIRKGRTRAAWSKLKSWEVKNHRLVLHRKQGGAPVKFNLRGLPNAHILLMLVESVLGGIETAKFHT